MTKLEQLIQEKCPNGVKYLRLEDCCNILDAQRKPVSKGVRTSGEYPYYGANGIQDYIDNNIFDGTFILIGKDGSVINEDGTPVVNWAKGKIILRPYQDYLNGYDEENRHFMGYVEVVNKLLSDFKLGTGEVWGENKEKEFIRLMGLLLKLRNILTTFDEFVDPLAERQLQDFSSEYADLYDKYRKKKDGELEEINDDVIFEIELLKQIEVNIDYILDLIKKYAESGDAELVASINSAINSSFQLRSKVKLINNFIKNLTGDDTKDEWQSYIQKEIVNDLEQIITEENLNQKEAYDFIRFSIDNGRFDASGTSINSLLPRMSRFNHSNRPEVKEKVVSKLKDFFDKYWDLGINV